jgi:hypothetical protein
MGKVSVSMAGTFCNVNVDGAPAGVTPVDDDVAVGMHVVRCTPTGGVSKQQSVEVRAGETSRVRF